MDSKEYDLSSFSTCPAVVKARKDTGATQSFPIPVPDTPTPSPLASSISIAQLKSLRGHLCTESVPNFLTEETQGRRSDSHSRLGEIDDSEPPAYNSKSKAVNGQGDEVWKSWKRAYDIWNGYYIEGRVNERWIGQQFLRIEEEAARERKARQAQRFANANYEDDVIIEDQITPGKNVWGKDKPSDLDLGGGFLPLKVVPMFFMPPDMLPSFITGRDTGIGEGYVESIQNAVWMPRQGGERPGEPHIGVDNTAEKLFSEYGRGEEKEDDGFDFGMAPLPLLRSKIIYTPASTANQKHGFHTYAKHQVWDQATSRVFNVPTIPLVPSDTTNDRRLRQSQVIYGDEFRDADNAGGTNEGAFQLDIRRCFKRIPGEVQKGSAEYAAITQNPERVFELGNSSSFPGTSREGLLPVDSSTWEAEREKDINQLAEYFIVNNHGSSLVVNGLQVRFGQIAGPLPSFAVIECPNSQVVFWWGVGGREHGAVPFSESRKRSSGYLGEKRESINKPAGEVWLQKIQDRRRRLGSGEKLWDDHLWKRYIDAARRDEASRTSPQGVGNSEIWDGPQGQPAHAFANGEYEFKNVVLGAEAQEREKQLQELFNGVVLPGSQETWFDPNAASSLSELANSQAADFWDHYRQDLLRKQKHYADQRRSEIDLRRLDENQKAKARADAVRDVITNKRKSSNTPDDDGHKPKKSRRESHRELLDAIDNNTLALFAKKLLDIQADQRIRLAEYLEGKPPGSLKRLTKEFWQKEKRDAESVEIRRVSENKLRESKGKRLLPTTWGPYSEELIQDFVDKHTPQAIANNKESERQASKEQLKRDVITRNEAEHKRSAEIARAKFKRSDDYQSHVRRREFLKRQDVTREKQLNLSRQADDEEARYKIIEAASSFRYEKWKTWRDRQASLLSFGTDRNTIRGRNHRNSGTDLQLQQVLKQSRLEAEAKNRKDFQETLRTSTAFEQQRRNHWEIFKRRAEEAGQTQDDLAQQLGFRNATEYVRNQMCEDLSEPVQRKMTANGKEEELQDEFAGPEGLQHFHNVYRTRLREGLNAIAEANSKTMAQVVREDKGSSLTPSGWIEEQVSQVTIAHVLNKKPKPSIIKTMNSRQKKDLEKSEKVNSARWAHLNNLLREAAEWDSTLTVASRRKPRLITYKGLSGLEV